MRFKCVSVDYTSSDCVARLGGVNMPVGLVDIHVHGCAVSFLHSVIVHSSGLSVCERWGMREREREMEGGREGERERWREGGLEKD